MEKTNLFSSGFLFEITPPPSNVGLKSCLGAQAELLLFWGRISHHKYFTMDVSSAASLHCKQKQTHVSFYSKTHIKNSIFYPFSDFFTPWTTAGAQGQKLTEMHFPSRHLLLSKVNPPNTRGTWGDTHGCFSDFMTSLVYSWPSSHLAVDSGQSLDQILNYSCSPRDLGCPDLPTLTDTLCWRSSPRWPHHTDFKPTDLWGQQVWDWLIWCGFKWWMQPGNLGGGEIRAKSTAWLSAAFAGVWWMLYLYRSMIHGTGEQIHYKPCMILTVTLHSFGSSFFFMNILDHPDHTRSVTTTQQLDFWAGQNPQASALDSISWGAVNHLNCSCLPE